MRCPQTFVHFWPTVRGCPWFSSGQTTSTADKALGRLQDYSWYRLEWIVSRQIQPRSSNGFKLMGIFGTVLIVLQGYPRYSRNQISKAPRYSLGHVAVFVSGVGDTPSLAENRLWGNPVTAQSGYSWVPMIRPETGYDAALIWPGTS